MSYFQPLPPLMSSILLLRSKSPPLCHILHLRDPLVPRRVFLSPLAPLLVLSPPAPLLVLCAYQFTFQLQLQILLPSSEQMSIVCSGRRLLLFALKWQLSVPVLVSPSCRPRPPPPSPQFQYAFQPLLPQSRPSLRPQRASHTSVPPLGYLSPSPQFQLTLPPRYLLLLLLPSSSPLCLPLLPLQLIVLLPLPPLPLLILPLLSLLTFPTLLLLLLLLPLLLLRLLLLLPLLLPLILLL